jgi:hypothetical protein
MLVPRLCERLLLLCVSSVLLINLYTVRAPFQEWPHGPNVCCWTQNDFNDRSSPPDRESRSEYEAYRWRGNTSCFRLAFAITYSIETAQLITVPLF